MGTGDHLGRIKEDLRGCDVFGIKVPGPEINLDFTKYTTIKYYEIPLAPPEKYTGCKLLYFASLDPPESDCLGKPLAQRHSIGE